MMGLYTAFWSVSLFGQAISVLYVMVGLQGAFAVEKLGVASALAPAAQTEQPALINPGGVHVAARPERG
jgi:hypothetical protein